VVSAIRLHYDAAVAVALTAVAAFVFGLIAAVVIGGGSPNLPAATIAFLLTGGFIFFRRRPNLGASTQ
jgi:hypothetical protein